MFVSHKLISLCLGKERDEQSEEKPAKKKLKVSLTNLEQRLKLNKELFDKAADSKLCTWFVSLCNNN